MKQKDIALIAVIIFVSAIVSYVLSNVIFGSPSSHKQQAEVVQPITTDLPQPDPHYFKKGAFDPTQPITVHQNTNQDPFQSNGNSQ